MPLFNKNKELIAYDFLLNDDLKTIEFGEFYDEEYDELKKVSLEIDFYENAKSKPLIIDDGKKAIYLSSFKNVIVYDNKEDAVEKILKNKDSFFNIYKNKLGSGQ